MIDYNKYRASKLITGVNITPFTDVVLVLLIVFMIAAPGLVTSSLNIQLPDAGSTGHADSKATTIALDREGRVYLEGEPVKIEDLEGLIRGKLEKDPDRQFLLNADRKIEHGQVIRLLDLVRSSGAKSVLVGTVRK